ncbi:MAG: division/cell wall cluster transcriptional repressor MraZ [Pirellulales bacterium]|nr:division/cell wall cluster transcriptional repressor MraZ [Pirellulales bacterium]
MPGSSEFLLGEFQRTLDDRYRVAIPHELADVLTAESPECILAKERPGCLSLWNAPVWQTRWDEGVALIRQKMRAGRLQEKVGQVQLFGRLLSTRHKAVQLAGRSRLLIPEGFREFLGIEPNGTLLILGAAVCVELWQPEAWNRYLEKRMPRFRRVFDQLTR